MVQQAVSSFMKRKLADHGSFDDQEAPDDEEPVIPRRARLDFDDSDGEIDDCMLSDTTSDSDSEDSDSEDSSTDSGSDDELEEIPTNDILPIVKATPISSVGSSSVLSTDLNRDGARSRAATDSDPDRLHVSKNRRKSYRPMRSPDPEDPKFKGVTVQFRTRLHQDQVQLLITAYFNCRKVLRRRGNPWRNNYMSSVINVDDHMAPISPVELPYNTRKGRLSQVYYPSGKQCASCYTRKTPLWRDAEDGTPLCNACGIRYKKYRVRCGHCWFVPKKDSKTNPICANCGERFRYSVLRFKHTIV